MKKILLLITGILVFHLSTNAQSKVKTSTLDLSTRIKKTNAAQNKSNSTNNLLNGSFELWTVDSVETFSGKTIRFAHPEMWSPINGLIFTYFLDLPVPISAVLNGTNTAAMIEIADMGYGSDLGTLIPTIARPLSLKGQFQFNGEPDYAVFEVFATKYNPLTDSSEFVGAGMFEVSTNTNGSYQNFQANIQYIDETVIPDTVYVFATYLEGELGTWLKFDNLSLDYTSTGVENERASQFIVYPNPSSNQIKITLKNNEQIKNATIEIKGIDGSLKLKLNNYQSNETIDISTLTSGLYILSVADESGIVSMKINKI